MQTLPIFVANKTSMERKSHKFNEVIQILTPMCMVTERLDLLRKVKDLQEYTERLEEKVQNLSAQ